MNAMTEQQDRAAVYTNRELSWLQFNERVLEESEDKEVPLFERLKFISIFQSNLDEFFMVRVGSLFDQTLLNEVVYDSKTGMTAEEQLSAIFRGVRGLIPRKEASYRKVLAHLKEKNVEQINLDQLTPEEEDYFKCYFENEILPLISPQVIEKRHPFPFLKNKEIYVGVQLLTKNNGTKLGIIPASGYFKRVIYLPSKDKVRFLLVEDLILRYADQVFSKQQVVDKTIFRITRNADIDVDDQVVDVDFDYRDAMEELLRKRRKLAPVRLELNHSVRVELLQYFCQKLSLSEDQVFVDTCPLDLSFVFGLADKISAQKKLFYAPLTPQISGQIDETRSMMEQIAEKDLLFHYPYNSIRPFIKLLNEAAHDPEVFSIRITLYRVAKNSQVVSALIAAAEAGKEVNVVVELRARFDEENNIDWSKRLEEAGCNVIYGLPGYKVHSKLLLIARRHGSEVQYFTQIGTGNYNEKTSTLYTDLSMMTANPEIGANASAVFNSLFMGNFTETSTHLLVAPKCFKPPVIHLIDQEIAIAKSGNPAQILLKMNSVTDKELIDKLIEASQAGVNITMVVRGICCFKPQVPGFTENIRIFSVVGRYLEHSRILVFGLGDRQKIYISSADFMTRNTERRVEVAAPVTDESLKRKVLEVMDVLLSDNTKLREQQADGTYVHVRNDLPKVNGQEELFARAYREREAAVAQKEEERALALAEAQKAHAEEAAAVPQEAPKAEAPASETEAQKPQEEKPAEPEKPADPLFTPTEPENSKPLIPEDKKIPHTTEPQKEEAPKRPKNPKAFLRDFFRFSVNL